MRLIALEIWFEIAASVLSPEIWAVVEILCKAGHFRRVNEAFNYRCLWKIAILKRLNLFLTQSFTPDENVLK
jgi:hypothetical protein